ncbi:hypothetical protein [Listeria booriae]|uniref:Uncharacterized protein n=1 Tax=Listeria booriae TaxID=1552123 RepID=A0A7X0XBN5_9LIST|nr:hypothetical protein [Listeria booriae]MBC1490963.1 hypothetical protein [Listeria booriae]MBC1491122.1 hypothetical protein [Listeria booriae]MBC2676234.1 hypothetical protein [Listeria booriae]MBC6151045.1 hypothetical protein [Listeria booriae]MBC6151206.1 hypothetical protein [Listeria booriae]
MLDKGALEYYEEQLNKAWKILDVIVNTCEEDDELDNLISDASDAVEDAINKTRALLTDIENDERNLEN